MKKLLLVIISAGIYIQSTATTYTVNSTSDANTGSGTSGTLRWCINQVNADPSSTDSILFNIASGGVQAITLSAQLPTLTHSNVLIDGYSEPGASAGNFANRRIMIQIFGFSSATFSFTITASNVIVRGFDVVSLCSDGGSFFSVGVRQGSITNNTFSNVKIQGNFFNVAPDGSALASGTSALGDAAQCYGFISGGISTAKKIVFGVDGDGINDDQEGNLLACATNASSATLDMRDVDSCTYAGNWIGLAPNGTTLVNYLSGGNAGHVNYPVYLGNCVSTVIGTNGDGVSDELERNVFADGIAAVWITYNYSTGTNPSLSGQPLRQPGKNMVAGNYIGTDATGNVASNRLTYGVVSRSFGNYIGCNRSEQTNSSMRNIISAMSGGVCIYEIPLNSTWNSVSDVIKGNWIGIGVNGTSVTNGGYGILSDHVVNTKIIGNVIGNMSLYGVSLGIASSTNSTINNNGVIISNNIIGLLPDAVTAAPISKNGILIRNGQNLQIANNIICNSISGPGIGIGGGINSGFKTQGIAISQNSIYKNGGLGIDLMPSTGTPATAVVGVTGNDGVESVPSSTTDPNLLMDYPIISTGYLSGNNLILTGYVGSAAGQSLFAGAKVEFFTANNSPADQNGPIVSGDGLNISHGEGQTYLGTVTTDANGNFSTTIDVSGKGVSTLSSITSTATDVAGNTSEFGPNYSNVTLPLKLVSFDARYDQSTIDLNWAVSDEENISSYTVQRSRDGSDFVSLNSQTATNSAAQKTYESADANFPDDVNRLYYRLRITDMSGMFTYSNVISININSSSAELNISPNPAKNFININFTSLNEGDYIVDIIDGSGAVVNRSHKIMVKGKNSWPMNSINNLLAGTYIIRVSNGTDFHYTKFLFMP